MAPRAFLNGLPTVPLSELDAQEQQCSICLTAYGPPTTSTENPPEQPRRLPCSHVFGAKCLATWLRDRNTCPLCRVVLFPREQSSIGASFPGFIYPMPIETRTRVIRASEYDAIRQRGIDLSPLMHYEYASNESQGRIIVTRMRIMEEHHLQRNRAIAERSNTMDTRDIEQQHLERFIANAQLSDTMGTHAMGEQHLQRHRTTTERLNRWRPNLSEQLNTPGSGRDDLDTGSSAIDRLEPGAGASEESMGEASRRDRSRGSPRIEEMLNLAEAAHPSNSAHRQTSSQPNSSRTSVTNVPGTDSAEIHERVRNPSAAVRA
ncbi:MAG: hypothetical protein Q9191_005625 [Dirinaria sp. TL-2023a]